MGAAVREVARFDDALDDLTVDDWLDRLGFPVEVRRIMLNSTILGLLNEQPELASAHAFAALLRTGADRARRGGPAAVRIGYPTVESVVPAYFVGVGLWPERAPQFARRPPV